MQITRYEIKAPSLSRKLKIALASDLHGADGTQAILSLQNEAPDLILMPGDIFDCMPSCEKGRRKRERSLRFLEDAGKIAPCYFTVGNHEWVADDLLADLLQKRKIVLLDDRRESVRFGSDEISLGGLTSPCGREGEYNRWHTQAPDVAFLDEFERSPGYKILLSHHPEFYPAYIQKRAIDLTVSGHAHGGQIRFFEKGLFAPGQGILPRLTSGVYENRLVIGRGLGNGTPFPRLFNPTELVYVILTP
ncbi:MAG: metallophosphoesterase [Clostridia bacterium]|nr:metallophosphoesterase [Clostridia bacterium]